MVKFYVIVIFIVVCGLSSYSQTNLSRQGNASKNDSLPKLSREKHGNIRDYLIISKDRDTTHVDTTLSIKKDYKFNYLRRDEFGLLPFANIGQTYTRLYTDFESSRTIPSFGATAKHFNYFEETDVDYYHVPTPLTELVYKTAFQQGQLLDAFFTINTSKQLNFSIAYKGLRSLGKYQHILTSSGNFRFTTNYSSKNLKYQARAHVVMQDILNQENGGLTDVDVENFKSGEDEFLDRSVFAPNFENAENILEGKRFYLDHKYNLLNPADSLDNNISIGQEIFFEKKYYQFSQKARSDYFGPAFLQANLSDKVKYQNFYNKFYIDYENDILGALQFSLDYNQFNYGYDKLTNISGDVITNRLKDEVFGIGGRYRKMLGGFHLNGSFGINLSNTYKGNFLDVKAEYELSNTFKFTAKLNTNSVRPNFNFLLYQSNYINYNWDNNNDFLNVQNQNLSFSLDARKIARAEVEYSTVNNYTYFQKFGENVKPFQFGGTINYLKVKVSKEFKVGKFALDNTVMYQNVLDGGEVFNLPEVITRNTLYFSDHLFKKALYLQTGITFNYFTEYNMDAYDPLLAEFYVQNETMIGNFPRLDFFINAKIRQTRIFLKAEHFNSSFTGYDFFSAPNHPYHDFTIRFGIVWNFFL